MEAGSSTNPAEAGSGFAAKLVEQHEALLLATAAASIKQGLAEDHPAEVSTADFPPALATECGSFVTLEKKGALRGCIGTIQPYRPLIVDISANAFSAAFRDPRFKPVVKEELRHITASISVLSPMQPMQFQNEEDLLDQLHPNETGLLINDRGHRAVFLPQVWESLPAPQQFLNRLKVKARLPENHWSDSMEAWRFQVAKTGTISITDMAPPSSNGPGQTRQ